MASPEINNEYSSNPSLPFDMVSDILLLLPVKTLSRLKLVSKSWLSLISSPSFRSSHRRSERNPLLLVATSESDGGGHHFHVLDYYKKRGGGGKALLDRETTTGYYSPRVSSWFHRRLVFSCGLDLVCMYDPDDFYIRNPATREQITLPRKSSGFPGHGGHAVAFAYLPSTGEYKVLRVFGVSPFLSLQHPIRRSEVFTLGSGRWREKEGPSFWVHDDNSAVVDEAVHFLPGIFTWRLAVGDLHHDDDEAIARFDLKKEKWSKLPLPGIRHFSRDSRDEAWDFRLTRLGGSLCMECSGRSRVDLWLLEEGRNSCASWVKAYSIDRCCYPHQLEERCWRGPTASCRSTTQRKNELKRRSLVGRATSGSAST
ncbi:F-box protein At3g07870-like [Asparagus officinalis]|uniref:F-box protein At3g07870-like n=1 Tax=Asparagus officinalis TaxID=4686 RepID=UPI00098E45E3|nr:F-box protein At3g07870-like [Asparagus officinalis]